MRASFVDIEPSPRLRIPSHWPDSLRPDALNAFEQPTPYLVSDLSRVTEHYQAFVRALPDVECFYAVKCNPSPSVVRKLVELGSSFEIASFGELQLLQSAGVDAADVIYSNPVKPTTHIAAAAEAGLRRFAFDSESELEKIARLVPGAAVYVRVNVDDSASVFPLSRKFGVDPDEAVELMMVAQNLELQPYGATFHVGSQCTTARSWRRAIATLGRMMRRLAQDGIELEMLNISGGFPARYVDPVPTIEEIGMSVREAISEHLPYRPELLAAEPGRFLVAESAVMATTIIGREQRGGTNWLYLDVGAYHGLLEPKQAQGDWRFPIWSSRADHASAPQIEYTITGPTCDSTDTMFFDVSLPATLDVDDRLYIGSTGAYTLAYGTTFNGFPSPTPLFVDR